MSDLIVGAPPLPELDPETMVEPPGAEADTGDDPEVPEAAVRAALAAAGGLVGHFAGDKRVPGHWRFSADELDDLTPPVTRMVNANPMLRRVVGRADALTAGMVLIRYITRNLALVPKEEDLEPGIRSGHLIAASTAPPAAATPSRAAPGVPGQGGPPSDGHAAGPTGLSGGPAAY